MSCQQLQAGQLNDLLTLHLMAAPWLQKRPHLGKVAAPLLPALQSVQGRLN